MEVASSRLNRTIRAYDKGRQLLTVGLAQAAARVIKIREEQRCVGVWSGVGREQAVHGREERFRILPGVHALAAQVGLELGHQQGCAHTFFGDVCRHQCRPLNSKIERSQAVSFKTS